MSLFDYQKYQDWVIFVIITLVVSFVFISLNFKIDTSGIVTLSLNFLISAARLGAGYLDNKQSFVWFALTNPMINLMWASVYYFTLQMIQI